MADLKFEEYDPESPPELLLGRRVVVEWAGPRYYAGTVKEYNEEKFEHFVHYDDNDKKWYKMPEKTFRFESSDIMYKEMKAGTFEGYQGPFKPYSPKDSKNRTTVTFYVCVDPKFLREGERPVLKGNLENIGGSISPDGFGVAMNMLGTNPALWWTQLDLPFALGESNSTGIFEYKYGVGNVLEGRFNRRPKSCTTQMYSIMFPDNKNSAFSGYKTVSRRDAFALFVRAEFEFFMRGEINAATFMQRLESIFGSKDMDIPVDNRKQTEDIMEDLFKLASDAKVLNSRMTLSLLAMVGRYGLTKETTEVSTAGVWGVGQDTRKKERPSASHWCYLALETLQMGECLPMDVKLEFGSRHDWCLVGLRETAERIAIEGRYSFLRAMPLLNKHKQPVTWTSSKGKPAAWDTDFAHNSRDIISFASSALESAIQEEAANAAIKAAADGKDRKDSKDSKEDKKEELTGKVLHKEWLLALVCFAPSVKAQEVLFQYPAIHSESTLLLPELAKWIKVSPWKTIDDIANLRQIVSSTPALRDNSKCPELAANLVHSSDVDEKKLFRETIAFITACSADKKLDDEDGGTSRPFVVLDNAVKEWFKRLHAVEKVEKKEKPKESLYLWPATTEPAAEPVTQADLDRKRLAALSLACDMLHPLLSIPFFNMKPGGLLFELGRCHFLKGEAHTILQAICSLGADTNGLQTYHPHIQQALSSRGVLLLTEIVPAIVHKPNELKSLVSIIDTSLGKTSAMGNALLYALAYATGGSNPSLINILQYQAIWDMLFRSRGISPSEWRQDSKLSELLVAVHSTLRSTANSIINSQISLSLLHVCVGKKNDFLNLLQLLRLSDLTAAVLVSRDQTLRNFDRLLDQVKCFSTFFCNCGIKIDSTQISNTVADLSRRYDSLELSSISNAFAELLAQHGTSLAWLHSLRESALFLNLWRDQGTICLQEKARGPEAKAKQQNSPRPGDEKNDILASLDLAFAIEGVELTQEDLVKELIPRVKREWQAMLTSVRSRSMGIITLKRTFGKLSSKTEMPKELITLARTGDGNPPTHDWVEEKWMVQTRANLEDYFMLEHMQKWLPSLLKLRDVVQPLLSGKAGDDKYFRKINDLYTAQKSRWEQQTLTSLTELVEPVKKEMSEFSPENMQFVILFSQCEKLLTWLLDHTDTNDFNRLLQICRSCNDESRHLSSIASLVYVRSMLLDLIYTPSGGKPSYPGLGDFVAALRQKITIDETGLTHLKNIHQTFEGLLGVIENQTLSGGIKSAYEVRDVVLFGTFVFKARSDKQACCVIEITKMNAPATGADGKQLAAVQETKTCSLEQLFDLRSKLMMTEFEVVPDDLVQQIGDIKQAIAKFVDALQVYSEMRDEIFNLCTAGHYEFQESFELRLKFGQGGLAAIQERLVTLRKQSVEWAIVVDTARDNYYFLNYFTIREILRMGDLLSGGSIGLLTSSTPAPLSGNSQTESALEASNRKLREAREAAHKKIEDEKKRLAATQKSIWNCTACTFENQAKDRMCMICGTSRAAEPAAPVPEQKAEKEKEKEQKVIIHSLHTAASDGKNAEQLFSALRAVGSMEEAENMLFLVSSSLNRGLFSTHVATWTSLVAEAKRVNPSGFILEAFGKFLNLLFAFGNDTKNPPVPSDSNLAQQYRKFKVKGNCAPVPPRRAIPPPGPEVKNRADMLISITEDQGGDSKSLPVWVACAETPEHVIEVVLSIYVRRARLPEPGEILFCSSQTTLEEIELILRRFIHAKPYGREENVFCIADIHALDYRTQCAVVERLRSFLADYGCAHAASLVMLSGKPKQVILNSFSSHNVDLPPLDRETLCVAVNRAFSLHCGETRAITSNINGGGKSHFILTEVSRRQKDVKMAYRRIPYRESSQASSLIARLCNVDQNETTYFHLDIGHIIPPNANTVLFELLVVGVLKGEGCRVYHRNNSDLYDLEIPNSHGEKTAKALRFCSLLPTKHLTVSPDVLDFKRPVFRDASGTQISTPEFEQMIIVCKFLRAYRANKFSRRRGQFDEDWNVYTDADITPEACFEILSDYCAKDGHPSFGVFYNFLQYLYSGVLGVTTFYVFNLPIEGLEELKDSFSKMLIETSKDFTLRVVPRGAQYGQVEKKSNERESDRVEREQLEARQAQVRANLAAARLNQAPPLVQAGLHFGGGAHLFRDDNDDDERPVEDEDNDDFDDGEVAAGAGDDGPPPTLVRMASAERAQQVAQQANQQAPPGFIRQISNDLAKRFGKMTTWESVDHPIVVFYTDTKGQEISGLDVFSLNNRFTSKFLHPTLQQALIENKVDLNKDWSELTTEEGMALIKKVEGSWISQARIPCDDVEPSYVITIDNMLKMLSIQLRLRNNLPVVIMGETGCGKSSLIRQLCALIRSPLRTLNIHGGMDDQDIIDWMSDRIVEAQALNSNERLVVFLDEVNTCNSMGLFKEIICDRSMDGLILPDSLKIIAACNPYRLKQGLMKEADTMAGLIFDHFAGGHGDNVGTGITDPLKDLVYRVHPLPESMVDQVFDFGALSAKDEKLYIRAMLHRQIGTFRPVVEKKKEKTAAEKKEEAKKKADAEAAEAAIAQVALFEANNGGAPPAGGHGAGGFFDRLVGRRAGSPGPAGGHGPNGGGAAPNNNNGEFTLPDDVIRALGPEEASKLLAQMMEDSGAAKMSEFDEFIEVFTQQVCKAQEFVRKLNGGERSVVSLRDVARCVKVFRWFGDHFAKQNAGPWSVEEFFNVKPSAQPHVRQAVVLSLAFCYHARLPREQRDNFRKCLEDGYAAMQKPIDMKQQRRSPAANRGRYDQRESAQIRARDAFDRFHAQSGKPKYGPRCQWLDMTGKFFKDTLRDIQVSFVKHMNLGEGIALNEALLENLFMLLISLLNYIPIFVVGKPGSSKSLAMTLVSTNLKGVASENAWLRSLPAVEVFSFQCSPLSTSDGIEQTFEAARRYKAESPATTVVVLLDEVGLAEQSPHLPLKVLHKVLDEGGNEAVVGISNWSLDPAKMNRAVHLYRPAPTVEDLSTTAEGMVNYANLKGYLQSLARAYNEVYSNQEQKDFWGLREFYSTVRHINRAMERDNKALDADIIMNAVQRNFGGRPREMESILSKFADLLGFSLAGARRAGVVELVRQNLVAKEARHLMLLTKNNAALGLMFDNTILSIDKTDVIFGSDFPLDQTDLQIMLNINKVKLSMAEGIPVVLVHCETLYESLYDLLNQHYTECGGQLYVRLAFGTHTRQCRIHPSFRIVVIVEKNDAYTRLAPPLLNRFEKQVMERKNLLTEAQNLLVLRLQSFCRLFVSGSKGKSSDDKKAEVTSLRLAFCGYHGDVLSSLVQSLPLNVTDSESLFQEAVNKLLWIATPEAVCRMVPINERMIAEHRVDPQTTYFKNQHHGDLPSFAKTTLETLRDEGLGSKVIVMTFSPLNSTCAKVISEHTSYKNITTVVLHELSSERDLWSKINEFFETCKPGSVFLLQCDPLAASARRIEHSKYILEKARGTYNEKRKKERELKTPVVEVGKNNDSEKKAEKEKDQDSKDSKDGDSKEFVRQASHSEPEDLGVHLMLLIHLPRNDSANFKNDFDSRWHSVFVDSIQATETSGLPDIQDMIGKSMSHIISTIDIRRVLLRSFRSSLARLVYLHQRTNEDVKAQIMFVLKALQEDTKFCSLIKDLICQMVVASEVSIDVMKTAQQEHELTLAGTFQAALHRSISETVCVFFAKLIGHLDHNGNWNLLTTTLDGIRDKWLYLCRKSITDMNIFDRLTSQAGFVEVRSDGHNEHHFVAQFPFSFYVNEMLTKMRAAAESTKGSLETSLQSQFALLNFTNGVDNELPATLLRRYCYDFTCMHTVFSDAIDRALQAEIVWRIITLHKTSAPTLLSQIHARYWQCERQIHAYFHIIDSLSKSDPACRDGILHVFRTATSFGLLSDLQVCNVVVQCLAPERQGWSKSSDYVGWMANLELVRPTVQSLLAPVRDDLNSRQDRKQYGDLDPETVMSGWEKILFYYVFIRDIAISLKINPDLTLRTLGNLRGHSLQSQTTFRVLLKMMSDLNKEYSRAECEFECLFCLKIPENPVRFCGRPGCQKMVCKQCADEYMDSAVYLDQHRSCPNCRTENCPHYIVINADYLKVDDSKNKERRLRAAASRLMEFYIFDFCLGSHTGQAINLSADLISDLILLLARRDLVSDGDEKYSIDVVPSDAARVTLLRSLLQLRDQKSQEAVQTLLKEQLEHSVVEFQFLDTPLSVCFASVQEQILEREIVTVDNALSALDSLNLQHVYYSLQSESKEPVHSVLKTMAILRRILSLFAIVICESIDISPQPAVVRSTSEEEKQEQKIVSQPTDMKTLMLFQSKLEPILADRKSDRVRTLRMFLLKSLERKRGAAFLRSALQQSPFVESTWLSTWKETGDRGLVQFLGSNKLPQNLPFKNFPLWKSVHAAVAECMQPSASTMQPLEAAITAELGDRKTLTDSSLNLKGVLLLAFFQEAFLLQVLPEIPLVTRFRLTALQDWVTTSPVLDFLSKPELLLLAFFTGSKQFMDADITRFLSLDNKSSPEQIGLVRLVAHVAAVVLSSPGNDHMAFFKNIMFSPSELKTSFFPSMPEDSLSMAVRALGGRWYRCVNGHSYYVDACGRPTEIIKCSTCGVDIGGLNHNPLPGQKDVDEKLEGNTNYSQASKLEGKSEPLYILRDSEQESKDPFDVARELTPLSNRAIRFILHCALILGAVVNGAQWETLIRPLFNPSFTNPTNLGGFLLAHLNQDFNLMKRIVRKSDDDTALLMHLVLEKVRHEFTPAGVIDEEKVRKLIELEQAEQDPIKKQLLKESISNVIGRRVGDAQAQLPSDTVRKDWEIGLMNEAFVPILNDDVRETRLDEAQKKFSLHEDEVDSVFIADLRERTDINLLRVDLREQRVPALWCYRRPFSYQDFVWQFNMNAQNKKDHTVLDEFLKDEVQLRALRFLPQLVQWQSMLLQKYNRQLEQAEANTTTVSQILAQQGRNIAWEQSFQGFEQAWNKSWTFVKRFGCTEIPAMYKDVKMSREAIIALSLPCQKDEGICPLALAQFLGQKHNQFVGIVDENLLMRGNELQRSKDRNHTMTSKFFTGAHALSYNLEDEFLPFVEKQCVQINERGDMVYDFKAAEQYLLDVYFMGKPMIYLEIPMIQYKNADSSAGIGLREKVKQEFLSKDVEQKILGELGSQAVARTCLELVDTCVSFLMAAGDQSLRLDVGDMSLGHYVRTVLCMEEVEFGSNLVTQKVQLKHVDCLRKLLRDYTVVDPFANVRPKYRSPIDEKSQENLRVAMAKVDLAPMLPAMKEYMIAQLSEDTQAGDFKIKDMLAQIANEELDVYLIELPGVHRFPDTLVMSQFLEVYRCLSKLQAI